MTVAKIIAHQGLTLNYPENTLLAFTKAREAGADKIEFDLHLTNDNQLVVHHDYELGNPDNGEGYIYEKTAQYIKSLTIQKGKHVEPIPFGEELFEKLRNTIEYEIELKGMSSAFVSKVLETVERYNLFEKIEFTSPHPYVLTYLKKLKKDVKTGMFIAPFPQWMKPELGRKIIIANAHLGEIDVLHCPISIISQEAVKQFHSEKFIVHAADCDNDRDIRSAIGNGVDQFSTNNLELALNIRKEMQKNQSS